MVSVKVAYLSTGKPAKNQKVSIGFSGLFRGFSETAYTNYDGEAHFDNDPGDGIIYINGNPLFKGFVAGMKVIYI
ncbi:MAG: hypothetical protein HXX09_09910 [Bacteroidetes bacterium]|nr:hypothetical protein [Bacteroidota bacterium]